LFYWLTFCVLCFPGYTYFRTNETQRPLPLEIICFHCQQAAEKYLKGYLVYKGVENVPYTHDLDLLSDMCLDIDERFADIEEACGVLTQYGVQPRYPHDMGLHKCDVQEALEYAQQIRDLEPLIQVRREISQSRV
jgi:HEPN domain-containing protein